MSSEKEDDSLAAGRTESGWRKIGALADFLDGLEGLALIARFIWGAFRWLFGLLRHLID